MMHWHAKWLIRRMFEGELGGARVASVMAHAATCDDCRAYYARHRQLEDVLYSGHTPTAARAIERLGAVVLAGVSPHKRPFFAAPQIWALAAALVLVLFSTLREPDEMRPRGGPAAHSDIGFRVLRLTGDGVENVSELHAGDTVTFTYSNRGQTWRSIQVLCLSEQGDSFVVGERPILPGVADEPLPMVLRVDAAFGGSIELIAVFTADGDVAIESALLSIVGPP